MFFGMDEKVVFASCVFEKLCFPEKTIFIVFSAEHSSCNKKAVCRTKHGKTVFFCLFYFFLVLVFLWVVFVCLVKFCTSVSKCLLFPRFFAFGGWHILVYLGLKGLGVFVSLVVVFLLFRFCLCLVCSVFVLLVDSFWYCSCYYFGGFFFCCLGLFLFCYCLFVLKRFCYFGFSLVVSVWLVFVLFFVFLGVV